MTDRVSSGAGGLLAAPGRLAAAGALLVAWPSPAAAHEPVGSVSQAVGTWNAGPLVPALLAVAVAVYLRGAARLGASPAPATRAHPARTWLMLLAAGIMAVALISPLDALSSVLFSAHMAQHLLLTAVAPLLVVLSRPVLPLMLGLPVPVRRGVTRALFPLRRPAGGPLGAGLVLAAYAGVLWLWHIPAIYEAALAGPAIHAVEHATLFGSALLMWSIALAPARPGLGLAALVFTALQGVALGALLTFSPRILYPSYRTAAWGLSALEHQQLGGLLMWMPTGVLYAACCLWLLARRVGPFAGGAAPQPVPERPAVTSS